METPNETAQQKSEGRKISKSMLIVAIALVAVLIIAMFIVLSGLLNPAADLTGTWESTFDCVYYELELIDPYQPPVRNTEIWGEFEMNLTQQDNTVNGTIKITPKNWTYIGDVHSNPIIHQFYFSGQVEGTIWKADIFELIQYEIKTVRIEFSFTAELMVGTISGNVIDSDTNTIELTRK